MKPAGSLKTSSWIKKEKITEV